MRESEILLDEVKKTAQDVLENCADDSIREWNVIKSKIKDEVSHLIYDRTRRTPMILPIIMDI